MNFFEGIVELGAAVVDTATAIVTYPVDIVTEGPLQATADLGAEIGNEVVNVIDVTLQSPLSTIAVAVVAN